MAGAAVLLEEWLQELAALAQVISIKISFVFVLLCRSETATGLNCKTCGFDVIPELSEVWKVRTETRSCSRRRLTFTCVYFCPLCSLSSWTRILESEFQFRRNKMKTLPLSEMSFGIMGV